MVSPLGLGVQTNWDALVQGRCGIGPITRFDASAYACKIAGEIHGFNPEDWVAKKDVKKMDLYIHYAMAASEMALKDAAYTIAPAEAERVGVYIGSGIGGLPSIERQHTQLLSEGPRRISPFFIIGLIVNMASGPGLDPLRRGAEPGVCTACATGTPPSVCYGSSSATPTSRSPAAPGA
jgi:3-oxoacyl-[acyl-carrier-protein] synthase II